MQSRVLTAAAREVITGAIGKRYSAEHNSDSPRIAEAIGSVINEIIVVNGDIVPNAITVIGIIQIEAESDTANRLARKCKVLLIPS